jgi:REP element-mobilizing transposase RayT
MVGSPFSLGSAEAQCVETSVRETCMARNWQLYAINVRTNHVHVVVSAPGLPEPLMRTLKAWATRALRRARLAAPDTRIWSRHGSTVYLWTERDIEGACTYVVYGQDK